MQIRHAPLLALACLLAACAQTTKSPSPGMPAPSSASGGNCNVDGARFAVGSKADAALVEQARTRSGSLMARVLRQNQAVTMEFNAQRLNLDVDANSVVTRVRCG